MISCFLCRSVDHKRIEEVGPDRACAEWLLKNGAAVKWKEDGAYLADYNALPDLEQPRKHIQAVDATNSAISHIGFPHFSESTDEGFSHDEDENFLLI